MEEIWKDVVGYEGLYQVSNLGRVKSIDTILKCKNGYRRRNGRILRQKFDGKGNYLEVSLSKESKVTTYSVHRLVAQSFIVNSKNKAEVNHKNRLKTDNRAENLEWCTRSENQLHRYINKSKYDKSNGVKGAKSKKAKKVYQYDLENNLVKVWG